MFPNAHPGVRRACRYEPDLNPAYQEMGIFDDIEAQSDWNSRTLQLSNPTPYTARVRVQRSAGEITTVVIGPSGQGAISLD